MMLDEKLLEHLPIQVALMNGMLFFHDDNSEKQLLSALITNLSAAKVKYHVTKDESGVLVKASQFTSITDINNKAFPDFREIKLHQINSIRGCTDNIFLYRPTENLFVTTDSLIRDYYRKHAKLATEAKHSLQQSMFPAGASKIVLEYADLPVSERPANQEKIDFREELAEYCPPCCSIS